MKEEMFSGGMEAKKPEEKETDKKPKEFYRTRPDGTVEFIENPYKTPEKDPNAEK